MKEKDKKDLNEKGLSSREEREQIAKESFGYRHEEDEGWMPHSDANNDTEPIPDKRLELSTKDLAKVVDLEFDNILPTPDDKCRWCGEKRPVNKDGYCEVCYPSLDYYELHVEWVAHKPGVVPDDKLREQIAKILTLLRYGDVAEWKDLTPDGKIIMLEQADQILSLIQPVIDQANRKGWDSCAKFYDYEISGQAVKAERERLIKIIHDLNSIGYAYGAEYKAAILKALEGEE